MPSTTDVGGEAMVARETTTVTIVFEGRAAELVERMAISGATSIGDALTNAIRFHLAMFDRVGTLTVADRDQWRAQHHDDPLSIVIDWAD